MSDIFHQNRKQNSDSFQNVKVIVRIRPLSIKEEKINVKSIVTAHTHRELMLKEKRYNFDRVFKPTATQIELYMNVIAPLIPDVVEGYNCTVFAYGQTGTGKTYTMAGEKCNLVGDWKEDMFAGIIPRTAFHIFHEINQLSNVNTNTKVSYLELYNEEIRDLLSDKENTLHLYSDTKDTVSIPNLTEHSVHDGEGICKLLQRGMRKKQNTPIFMNHQNSRSHTIFTVSINTREKTISGDYILKTGKISLIELAGNENTVISGCGSMRTVGLISINRPLSTLERVICALVDKSRKHVPYRDSKLTRILQESLGGHTKTIIIATVSPASNSFEESRSTLDYATKARDIKNIPTVNEKIMGLELIEDLVKEIVRLQKDLDAARSGTGFYLEKENYQIMLDAIMAVTGDHITSEELIEKKAAHIKSLEDRVYSRVREFEETTEQYKKRQQEVESVKVPTKEQGDNLEMEKFFSKWFQNQTIEQIEEAQKDRTKHHVNTMRKKVEVFGKVLAQYEQQLNFLKSEVPKMADYYRRNLEKFLAETLSLIDISDITIQQNKTAYENLDSLEATLLQRKLENESLIALLQKRIEEDDVALNGIKTDKENMANVE